MCWWNVFGQVPRYPTGGEVAHWVLRLPDPTSVLSLVHSVLFAKCAEWCGNDIAQSTDASRHDHDKLCFGGAHTKDEMRWSLDLVLDPRCALLNFSAWTREIVAVRTVWCSQNEGERCQLRCPQKKMLDQASTRLDPVGSRILGNCCNFQKEFHELEDEHAPLAGTALCASLHTPKKTKRHGWQSQT